MNGKDDLRRLEAAGHIRRSLESTERGSALTRQLLMFSGQRAGSGGARGSGSDGVGLASGGAAQGRRALVVDDDPDVAETMGDALEQAGLPATIARTGAEAIRIAGEVRPVLVFAMSCSARGCRATTSRAPCAPIRGCATPR